MCPGYLLGHNVQEKAHIQVINYNIMPNKGNNIFINVWRKNFFDIYFTEFGAVMTTVLPVLFKYCYKYCYSDSSNFIIYIAMSKNIRGVIKRKFPFSKRSNTHTRTTDISMT
jgi:hypothetical protein